MKIKVSNLERLDKGVETCNIWKHFTHKIDLTKHEPSTPLYRFKCLGEQEARVGRGTTQKSGARVLTNVNVAP